MGTVENLNIIRWQGGKAETKEDKAAGEALLRVRMNKKLDFNITITPEDVKEFVYGNLITEGWIKGPEDVRDFRELKRKDLMEVEVEFEESGRGNNYGVLWNYNVLASDCGNMPIPENLEEGLSKEIILHTYGRNSSQ